MHTPLPLLFVWLLVRRGHVPDNFFQQSVFVPSFRSRGRDGGSRCCSRFASTFSIHLFVSTFFFFFVLFAIQVTLHELRGGRPNVACFSSRRAPAGENKGRRGSVAPRIKTEATGEPKKPYRGQKHGDTRKAKKERISHPETKEKHPTGGGGGASRGHKKGGLDLREAPRGTKRGRRSRFLPFVNVRFSRKKRRYFRTAL